jgi:class 3 adenylate cyclase
MRTRITLNSYFIFIFFIFWSSLGISQNQKIADSLKLIYNKGEYADSLEFEILRGLAFNEMNDNDLALDYAEILVRLATEKGNLLYQYRGYLQKGRIKAKQGELDSALDNFLKSAELAKTDGYLAGQGGAYLCIADVYSVMENFNNAETYYNEAIQILRKTEDSISLASALLNAGDAYFNNKKYDKALQNFEESGIIFKKVDYLSGTAYNQGNIGMVYAEQGKDSLAAANMNQAIGILEELKDYYPISVYLTYMSDIYLRKSDTLTALKYAQKSLELASSYGLKDQISAANLKLSELYEGFSDYKASNRFYKQYIAYRDSVRNIETVQKMADQRTDFEVSQKQIEVDLLNQQKRNQLIILGFTGVLLLTLFWYYRSISREKKRSERLLLNILPAETAQELKEKGRVVAKKIESVTVLFADLKGFTRYSEHISPEALVETVGYYFSKFDEIVEKHGLEKIKTMGDAYMCAGGLHDTKKGHPHKMVAAAFEIIAFVEETKKNAATEMNFEIRIGINTGPVVAGVVGSKKFAYDIWGDTVNVASRMESMSEPGKINISENTFTLVKDDFVCEYRGEFEVKNRGILRMYFVYGAKKIVDFVA